MNPLPGSLQWWHLIIGMAGTITGVGLAVFGRGFAAWSARLKEMAAQFDKRLQLMDSASEHRWNEVRTRMAETDRKIHDLHVQVERRVSYIEARMGLDNNK